MASVFPIRGRPTSEGISKRISLTSSTCPLDGKERKPGNTGVFAQRVRQNPAPSNRHSGIGQI